MFSSCLVPFVVLSTNFTHFSLSDVNFFFFPLVSLFYVSWDRSLDVHLCYLKANVNLFPFHLSYHFFKKKNFPLRLDPHGLGVRATYLFLSCFPPLEHSGFQSFHYKVGFRLIRPCMIIPSLKIS